MSLDPDEMVGLTEEDMGELRNMFDWKPVSRGMQIADGSWHWLTPVDDLVVNRTTGEAAAGRYLFDKAQEVIHCQSTVMVPIAIILFIIGALGLIAWAM